MDLLIVNSEAGLSQLPVRDPHSARMICLDFGTQSAAKSRGWPAILYDQDLDAKLAQKADRLAYTLAQNWQIASGKDFTTYEGISLGQAHGWTLWWTVLMPRFKFAAAMQTLIKIEKPSHIFYDASMVGWRAQILQIAKASHRKIQLIPFGSASMSKDPGVMGGSFSGWKPMRFMQLKGAASQLIRLGHRLSHPRAERPVRVLAGTYFSTFNVWSAWAKAKGAGGERRPPFELVLLSPPMTLLRRGEFISCMPDIFRMEEGITAANPTSLERIRTSWESAKKSAAYRRAYRLGEMELFEVFEQELDAIVSQTFRQYALEYEQYDAALEEQNIGAMVLSFDVTPRETLLIQAAKKRSIPTVTLLHGFPFLHEFNHDENLKTDELLVWGGWMQKRFGKAAKGKRIRITQTGNPKFDSIDPLALTRPWAPPNARKPRILILSFPRIVNSALTSDGETEAHVLELISALNGLEADISIKLHPSESIPYYRSLMQEHGLRAQVMKEGDILEHIKKSDIVIGPISTALLEAMLMGKPTLYFNKTQFRCDAPLFNGQDGLREYTDAKEVRRSITRLLKNEPDAMEGHRPSRERMEYYCGPLDQKSSQRALKAIERILDERAR